MPELPEVEVTRSSVAPRMEGAQVLSARLGLPLRWPLGCALDSLATRTVLQVARRGKYLWFELSAPQASTSTSTSGGGLLMHLGMSGALTFAEQLPPPGKHDHFELITTRGRLRLTDPRRFGAVVWSDALTADPAAKLLSRLGPEPFDPDLTDAIFYAALQKRSTPIKTALLGGELVVGAGNIYACEALFTAGIHPETPCRLIGPRRAARLLAAVRSILAQALGLGGSTLRDFHDAHGMAGQFQTMAQVYGREGQPCKVCTRPISRLVQAQRSTYFCSHCQRPERQPRGSKC